MLRFNPWLFVVNAILIIQFFLSWYYSAKKTGWTIDFWRVTLFLSYFLTFLLMYPFASAKMNALVIGTRNLEFARKSITIAYLLSLVGYCSIFVGGFMFTHYKFKSPIYGIFIRPVKSTIGVLFEKIVINRRISKYLTYFYFISLAMVLFFAYLAGKGNDPRSFYGENNQYLFIFNFVNSLSGIVSAFLVARIFQFNKLIDKIFFVLFIIATLFIGSRGGIIGPLLGFLTSFVYFRKKGRIKISTLMFSALGMLCLILGLSLFRAGQLSVGLIASSFMLQVFYGNSFSDLRDFSWIYSVWHGVYFYGNSYFAAIISFIPSSLSPYRMEWSIGKLTAVMAGYNPKKHPGLRPGMFGESFLNFGIFGIITLGILLGYSWKYLDYKIKEAAKTGNIIEASVAGVGCMIMLSLPITSGFFGIYVNIVVFLALYFLRLFFVTYKKDVL